MLGNVGHVTEESDHFVRGRCLCQRWRVCVKNSVRHHMDSSHVVSPDGTGINAGHIDCRIEDFSEPSSPDGATSTRCTL